MTTKMKVKLNPTHIEADGYLALAEKHIAEARTTNDYLIAQECIGNAIAVLQNAESLFK